MLLVGMNCHTYTTPTLQLWPQRERETGKKPTNLGKKNGGGGERSGAKETENNRENGGGGMNMYNIICKCVCVCLFSAVEGQSVLTYTPVY